MTLRRKRATWSDLTDGERTQVIREIDDDLLVRCMKRAASHSSPRHPNKRCDIPTSPACVKYATRLRSQEARRRWRHSPDEPAFPRAVFVAQQPKRVTVAVVSRQREQRSTGTRTGAQRRATRTTSGDDPPGEPASLSIARRAFLQRRAITIAFRARVDGATFVAQRFRAATDDLTDAERAYVLCWLPPWAQEHLAHNPAGVR